MVNPEIPGKGRIIEGDQLDEKAFEAIVQFANKVDEALLEATPWNASEYRKYGFQESVGVCKVIMPLPEGDVEVTRIAATAGGRRLYVVEFEDGVFDPELPTQFTIDLTDGEESSE